jgi:uncharacterized protein YggT (Ycf19 family)
MAAGHGDSAVGSARWGQSEVAMLLVVLHTLILVAGLSLLGQGIVGIFNWRRRHDNFVYQLFAIITRPVVMAVRAVTPRVVLDEHVPLVAFLLLLIGYFAVGLWHRDVCLDDLTQAGCAKWAAARAGAQ